MPANPNSTRSSAVNKPKAKPARARRPITTVRTPCFVDFTIKAGMEDAKTVTQYLFRRGYLHVETEEGVKLKIVLHKREVRSTIRRR